MSLTLMIGLTAAVLVAAVIAVRLSSRLGLPSLLPFLGIGLLLGEEGLGIQFSDADLARDLGYIALVLILAEGGLTTKWEQVRTAAWLGLSLSTVAVAVSTVVTGVGVHLILGFDWRSSLLWGAVVSSTDAAAVFSVLRGVPVRKRLGATLELESGLNDPPVVIAVVLLASSQTITWFAPVMVVYQLVVGAIIGLLIALLAGWLLRRVALPTSGLYPMAVLAVVGGSYALADLAHTSGFLAVYVTAVVLGNIRLPHRVTTQSFAEGMAHLAQVGLFVLLGLYASPGQLIPAILPGIGLGLFLLLVARPLSVLVSTASSDLSLREKTFVSWAGLRGAVPIVLATVPLTEHRPTASLLVAVVFVVVVFNTLVQGISLMTVGRALDVLDTSSATDVDIEGAPLDELNAQVLLVRVPDGSKLAGVTIAALRLPPGAKLVLVQRAGELLELRSTLPLRVGDGLLVVTPQSQWAATERRLRAVGRAGALADWLIPPNHPKSRRRPARRTES